MDIILPKVGTKGIFTLKAPYDSKIEANQEYRVVDVSDISNLQEEYDVFELIYKPVNLSIDDFKDDLSKRIPIVVLLNDANKKIYFPADRIDKQPVTAGVRYKGKAVILNLGPLPVDYDTSLLEEKLDGIVLDVVGLKPKITYSSTSATTIVDYEKDKLYQTKLSNSKKTIESDYQKILRLEAELAEKTKNLNDLTQWAIKVKNGDITP